MATAGSLLWSDAPREKIEEWLAIRDNDALLEGIAQHFGFAEYKDKMIGSIQADFHFLNFVFARDSGFTPEKISVFMALMRRILQRLAEPQGTVADALKVFSETLLAHTLGKAPFERVFAAPDVEVASNFAAKTVLAHGRLWHHILTHEQAVDRTELDVVVLTAAVPLPLAKGEPIAAYEARIAAEEQQKREAEEKAAAELRAKQEEARRLEEERMAREDAFSREMTAIDELTRPPLTAEKIQKLAARTAQTSAAAIKTEIIAALEKTNAELVEKIAALTARLPEAKKK